MKKTVFRMVGLVLSLMILLSVPAFAAGGIIEGADYQAVDQFGYRDLGTYAPGTYYISSTDLSDSGNKIMNELEWFCGLPVIGDAFPGCDAVQWAGYFIVLAPHHEFYVRLTDANTGGFIWEGKLTAGTDFLYLGSDHASYRVEMRTVLPLVGVRVYLLKG